MHRLRISIGSFTAKRLRAEAGIPVTISMWTIRRVLSRHGYRYLQSRRKGMLTHKYAYKRLRFARRVKRLSPSFWKRYSSFYFDGTSFVHKTNPYDQARAVKSLAWRTRNERLALYCTSKGKKAGVKGRSCPFLCSYRIQERSYMLWKIYSKIEWWIFCILYPQHISFAFSSQRKPKSNALFTRW